MLYRLNFKLELPCNVIRSGRPYLTSLVLELEQSKVVEEELEVLKDLESLKVEDSSLPIENEDISGCRSFYNNNEDIAWVYGAIQRIS